MKTISGAPSILPWHLAEDQTAMYVLKSRHFPPTLDPRLPYKNNERIPRSDQDVPDFAFKRIKKKS